jgi:hypothetical protein
MDYSDEQVQAVANVIALWDYRTNTGEDPDSDEDITLPPHYQAAVDVLAVIETFKEQA